MKKLCCLLLMLCLCLSGCATLSDPLTDAVTPLSEVYSGLPDPVAPASLRGEDTVTLYFRYLDEPYLAPESRTVTLSPGQSRENAILQALLTGPDVQSASLRACFPAGVKLLSSIRHGRTLFVTLNAQIMQPWPDEPSAWQADAYWAQEAPLRRQLAMQSLIASITENCDVDTVQVLAEQSGQVTDSLRLRESYYLISDDPTRLAAPLQRNDALLLTPENTLHVILTLWQSRDWTRLSRYVTPDSGAALTSLPHLTDFAFTGGSVSPDSQTATFTLTASLYRDQTEITRSGRIIRLHREAGLWRISQDQLTGWLED